MAMTLRRQCSTPISTKVWIAGQLVHGTCGCCPHEHRGSSTGGRKGDNSRDVHSEIHRNSSKLTRLSSSFPQGIFPMVLFLNKHRGVGEADGQRTRGGNPMAATRANALDLSLLHHGVGSLRRVPVRRDLRRSPGRGTRLIIRQIDLPRPGFTRIDHGGTNATRMSLKDG
jgi:hypothetical protein